MEKNLWVFALVVFWQCLGFEVDLLSG